MASFSSPAKQAAKVLNSLQGRRLKSVGTVRNYRNSLTRVAEYNHHNHLSRSLTEMTATHAVSYLQHRSHEVGQKSLDLERQALQVMMQSVTNKLDPDERLPVIKSDYSQVLVARAYTQDQMDLISNHQTDSNTLATQISYAAGLRAHELYTILPVNEQQADPRPALEEKFLGREEQGVRYSVVGKGGLIREVDVPKGLSAQLELRRLSKPRSVTDREIHYQQHYDISGGHAWSHSFSAASIRTLGWSNGAHGLRHSYAQERMDELQKQHYLKFEKALEIVSQEMGHFRPEITEVYLR